MAPQPTESSPLGSPSYRIQLSPKQDAQTIQNCHVRNIVNVPTQLKIMAVACNRAPNTKPKAITNIESFDVLPSERGATVAGSENEDELLAGGGGGDARLEE